MNIQKNTQFCSCREMNHSDRSLHPIPSVSYTNNTLIASVDAAIAYPMTLGCVALSVTLYVFGSYSSNFFKNDKTIHSPSPFGTCAPILHLHLSNIGESNFYTNK